MATSREERMNERLRGGRVHQVEDISFGDFILPDEEELSANLGAEPWQGSQEKSGADSNPRQASSERHAASPQNGSQPSQFPGTEVATTSSPNQVRGVPDVVDYQVRSPGSSGPRSAKKSLQPQEEVTESPADAPGSGHRRRVPVRISAAASQSTILQQYLSSAQRDPDRTVDSSSPAERRLRAKRLSAAGSKLGASGGPVVPASSSSRRSASISHASDTVVLGETPGAGLGTTGAGLNGDIDGLSPENPTVTATVSVSQSSPIARILQKTRGRGIPRNLRRKIIEATSLVPKEWPSQHSAVDKQIAELRLIPSEDSQGGDASVRSPTDPGGTPDRSNSRHIKEAEKPSEVEETNDQEAARKPGHKRPHTNLQDVSPELSSAAEGHKSKATKRRRALPPEPILEVQEQPAPNTLKEAAKKKKVGRVHQRSEKTAPADDNEPEPHRGGSIQVPVQRYIRPKRGGVEDENDKDDVSDKDNDEALGVTIPFAAREGVNSVDILSQLCEEVTANVLKKLRNKAAVVSEATSRSELKTKMSAVEAFREELRTNMLQHTIALDNLQTLRRRLRSAQKEKRTLRDQIFNIRREREQVALRRDALRMKHEHESQKVMDRLRISSTMQDIELAVEEGRSAPELSAKEQKQAELANLELLMLRVGDQIRPNGYGLGVLDQVKSFNTYLERAAAAIQGI